MRDKLPQMMNQCQYMKAAKMALEKTTFHAIPWVLEDVPTLNKVNPANQQNFILHKKSCFRFVFQCISFQC